MEQPDDARLTEIYDESYYEAWEWERREVVQAAKERTMLQALELVEVAPQGRILDVGCARGEFAAALVSRGYRVSGVDLNPDAVRRAQQSVPEARFYCGELQPDVVGTGWDIVTMFDLLEHVRDPIDTLRRAASVLAPDGRLLIATPRTGSVVHRLAGRHWPQYREEHLVLFSSEGLKESLALAGLDIERVRSWTKYSTGAYLLGQFATYSSARSSRLAQWLRWSLRLPPMHRLLPLRFGEMVVVARPR